MNPLLVRPAPAHHKPSKKTDGRNLRLEHLEPRLVLSSSSLLQHLTASGSAVTLGASADAYINSFRPTTNYGKNSDLLVQNWSGSTEAYLKYNLNNVPGTITSAYLNLRVLARSMSKSTLTLNVKLLADANDTWVEGTGGTNRKSTGAITWANSPDGVGLSSSITITSAQLRKSSLVSIDVTSLVNQSFNTNKTASFVISASSSSRFVLDFASRDNRNSIYRPTLSLTTLVGDAPTIAEQPTVSGQTSTQATLSVLGNDTDDQESNLTYTWSYTTTSGGTVSFIRNGTNAAKDTTASFSKAGTYYLSATVRDSTGLTVKSSSVAVTFTQTLSDIVISPATVTLVKDCSRQFTVTGVDQFGQTMSLAAGSVEWSASTGAFSSGTSTNTVTYVAPSQETTGTVTATVGSFTATSAVTIVATNFLNLNDVALACLTQSLFADGSISRLDMITIFNTISGEADGIVDANNIADLRTILSNSSTLCMANYVYVLASDVVNGNTANAKYLGTTLGNLAAGNANLKLDKLVNKWFYGTDLPTTGGYSYDTGTAGTLFGSYGPSHADEKQGSLGDCYFLSAMGSIADSSQTAIANMFIDNGDNTWTVRFYYYGTADYVTVNDRLPITSSGYLIFQGYGSRYTNSNNTLWLSLLEKAYAQWNETGKTGQGTGTNSYLGIEGGWMGTVYAQALGYAAADYYVTSVNQQALIAALSSGKAVTIGTKSSVYSTTGLYGNHAYNVLSYSSSTGKYTLYNPWGSNQPNQLTWTQLTQNCDWFSVANTAGSVPISAVKTALLSPVALTSAASSVANATENTVLSSVGTRSYTLSAEIEKSASSLPASSVDALFENRDILFQNRSAAIAGFQGLESERLNSRIAFDSAEDSVFDNLDAALQLTQLLLSDAV